MRAAKCSVLSAVNGGVEASHKSLLEAQILLDQNNRDATRAASLRKDHRKERGTRDDVCDRHEYVLARLTFPHMCTSADDDPLMRVMPRPIPK